MKIKLILSSILFMLLSSNLLAQDGKVIYDTKCKACHDFKNKLVGPALGGITEKRSEEWLSKWITNNEKFSTQDEDAKVARVMGAMPAFEMPDADMKALIAYMKEAGTAKEEPAPAPIVTEKKDKDGNVIAPPKADNNDYVSNQFSLLILLVIGFALILIIVHLLKNIKHIAQSDVFKKIADKMNSILLLITFSSISLTASAQEVSEITDYLVKINRSQLWMIAGVVLFLALVALYLAFKLNSLTNIIAKASNQRTTGLLSGLTQAVAIEDEKSILMDHEYDGIRELDNDLPPWWKWGFAITVVFGIIYYLNYQILKTAPNQEEEYAQEMARMDKEVKAYKIANNLDFDETNIALLEDQKSINAGKAIYTEKCVVCHKSNGSGSIGVNLTDKYWLYGNTVADMYKIIKEGTNNGMLPHEGILNGKQIQQVASYIKTLPFAEGKEPQGKLYE